MVEREGRTASDSFALPRPDGLTLAFPEESPVVSARMTRRAPDIASFRRIVVKVGSSLLVDPEAAAAKSRWLTRLADDIASLHRGGADVLVVSSGAVALGRSVLGFPHGVLPLEDSQAAAAVGQIALARLWAEALHERGLVAGQVLVTFGDTEERRRYLYARECLNRLLSLRAVPVINENDTVATAEIRYGDNDRLAARVATMASADLLVLLSDVDGLYTAPPASDPTAKRLSVVPRITAEIEAMAGGAASQYSRGGMRTKIEAAKIATTGGAHMVIADGRAEAPIERIRKGGRCTWFLTPSNPVTARKKWIAGSLEPKGAVHIDEGAARALLAGASLLPAGVTRIEGGFARGDCIVIRNHQGGEIGRGLVTYDAVDAAKIAGRSTKDIEGLLGFRGPDEVIHRDDMALAGE
jgi:glutamate 5-kinase